MTNQSSHNRQTLWLSVLLLIFTAGDVAATARIPAGGADRLRCTPYAAIELCHSVAQIGDSWLPDFDAGFYRSNGVEAGFTGALSLQYHRWSGEFSWRGRWGEQLPARGRLDAATVTHRWRHLELGLGRGHFDWTPTQEVALLLSRHARAIDHFRIKITSVPVPWNVGLLGGESFIGRLDDPDRMVPNPWLWGMRLTWRPQSWLMVSAERSIMLAGAGRGEKLTPGDIWDIFLGRGEGAVGGGADGSYYHHADTNQLFAWQLNVHPRQWVRRVLGLDDLAICIVYAGEDRFERMVPMAPGRAYAIRLHPRPWLAISYVDLGNRDDRNHWYWHKIYGDGYTYRGVTIGHAMGGEAMRWRAGLFLLRPESSEIYFFRLIRESRSQFWDPLQGRTTIAAGGFSRFELGCSVPLGETRPYFIAGLTDAWNGDRRLDRLAAAYFRIGVELSGSVAGNRLDGSTVWGLWPGSSL